MAIKEYEQASEQILMMSPLRERIINNKEMPLNNINLEEDLNKNIKELNIIGSKLQNPLRIVLMGEVKAGKSTLLNALAGGQVSPTNVVEATASIIEVVHSDVAKGEIINKEGRVEGTPEYIFNLLTKNNNDQDFFKSIEKVRISKPLENLKELYIVDTPGLATITDENERRTKEYIQQADVVLWVINGNYLGQSDVEEELINVAKTGKPIVAVVNRIDEVDAEPEEVIAYVEEELGIYIKKTFALSSYNAYNAVVSGDEALMDASGYTALLHYLKNNIERNASQVKNESLIASIKALLTKEVFIHENYIESIKGIEATIESHGNKVEYHGRRILERIERKMNAYIYNDLLRKEEEELIALVEALGIMEDDSIVQDKFKKYFNQQYVSNALNSFIKDISELYKKEWETSFNIINSEIDEEIKFLINKNYINSQQAILKDIPLAYQLAIDGMKEGAAIAGAWGAALAGYAAWLGPHAAAISIGSALGAIVPPILIAGAITGAAAKAIRFKNKKEEYIKNIKFQIEHIRKEIGQQFIDNFMDLIEDKNRAMENSMKNEFSKSLCNSLEFSELKELKHLTYKYSEILRYHINISEQDIEGFEFSIPVVNMEENNKSESVPLLKEQEIAMEEEHNQRDIIAPWQESHDSSEKNTLENIEEVMELESSKDKDLISSIDLEKEFEDKGLLEEIDIEENLLKGDLLNDSEVKEFLEHDLSVMEEAQGNEAYGKSISDVMYINRFNKLTKEELCAIVYETYESLVKSYNYEAGFGEAGAREFVASLILANYDLSVKEYINYGIMQVFKRAFGPMDFSDYMDGVIEKSIISYDAWSESYRYLKENHPWISEHPCATGKTYNIEKTINDIVHKYMRSEERDLKTAIKALEEVIDRLNSYGKTHINNMDEASLEQYLFYYSLTCFNLAQCNDAINNYKKSILYALACIKVNLNIDREYYTICTDIINRGEEESNDKKFRGLMLSCGDYDVVNYFETLGSSKERYNKLLKQSIINMKKLLEEGMEALDS